MVLRFKITIDIFFTFLILNAKMKLNFYQKKRIISLYYQHQLPGTKNKYSVLQRLASIEKIIASQLTFLRIISKWLELRQIGKRCNESIK